MNPKSWFEAMQNFVKAFPDKHQKIVGTSKHKKLNPSWRIKRTLKTQKKSHRRIAHQSRLTQQKKLSLRSQRNQRKG